MIDRDRLQGSRGMLSVSIVCATDVADVDVGYRAVRRFAWCCRLDWSGVRHRVGSVIVSDEVQGWSEAMSISLTCADVDAVLRA